MSAGNLFRQLASRESYGSQLGAFALATVLGCAPWLLPALGIAILVWLAGQERDALLFRILVLYAITFSLIAAGAVQTFGVRFLWDRLYAGDRHSFVPAFCTLLLPLVGGQVLLAVVATAGLELPGAVRAAWLGLYAILHGVWLAAFWLGAVKDHAFTAFALALGVGLSIPGALAGFQAGGLAGQFLGLAAGYAVSFACLLSRMVAEFGYSYTFAWRVWAYLPRLFPLFLAGLCYGIGLWADKFVFWAHPDTGVAVLGWLRMSPHYDNAVFLASLTIVPALGLFLMHMDTEFGDRYREIFATIGRHAPLSEIVAARERALACFHAGLGFVLRLQAPLALGIALFAAEIMSRLGISWLGLFAFRYSVVAMLLQLIHLVALIALIYFDFRKSALLLGGAFLVAQVAGAWLSIGFGPGLHGLGGLVANGLVAVLGIAVLEAKTGRLEYHVFRRQVAGA
ncbi:MAG: exopolysaccharide Pel transporter PelG [Candidatus Sericytochromatia bacterium]|nr:exopolysaccharide Pel transporter PelG [Candidatus Tanganyikabacteria bacterium]